MMTEFFDIKSWVNDVNERLLKLEKSYLADPLSTPNTQLPSINNPISISDFMKIYSAKSLLEKALIFSFYIEKIQNISPFGLHDINQCFRDARETLPGNPSDIMYQAVKKDYLMKVDKGKNGQGFKFQMTNNGLKFIDSLKTSIEPIIN